MSELTGEAIIVHGCQLEADGELSQRGIERMETALDLFYDDVAPNLVLTGNHSFTVAHPPQRTEAEVMRQYALDNDVDPRRIHVEERSLDTVGNVIFTKVDHIVPHDWRELIVVTSKTHMDRALAIYDHVLGSGYTIHAKESKEAVSPDSFKLRLWERLGDLMVDEVLAGTTAGDDEAIRARLFDLVPTYETYSPTNMSQFGARLALRQLKIWRADLTEQLMGYSAAA